MLVACVSDEYSHRPLIARVEAIISEKKVRVQWYESGRGNAKSGWSKSWRESKIRGVLHKENIDVTDIIWQDFTLTESNRLRKSTVEELKDRYWRYDNEEFADEE